jgi:hypothetical protein
MTTVLENIIELLQVCLILFLIALFVSYALSNIFTLIDKEIDKVDNIDTKNFCIILTTFTQLCITTIIYFYVEKNLHRVKLWKMLIKDLKRDMYIADLDTFRYAIHIVLIIVLIEMNSSLKSNLHYIGQLLLTK